MHHHVFYDTNVSLLYNTPELVYRSRGAPLSLLINSNLLARSRNIYTELQKEYPKHEVINSLAAVHFNHGLKGFVGTCGFNHTELEVVCVGAQQPIRDVPQSVVYKNELDQCFSDIFTQESPRFYNLVVQPEETIQRAKEATNYSFDLETFHSSTTRSSKQKIHQKPFRLNRLAIIRPKAFGTDRIAEIRVDDKLSDRAWIYARNANGFSMCRLNVDESEFWNDSHTTQEKTSEWDYFPHITPNVTADMSFNLDNTMTTMFVSPHEFGVFACTTKKKQLVVWDATVAGPCSKINLFKSTEKHMSYGEMYTKWHGCIAGDVLECGTFTDRHDSLLVGGSKLYLADLRSRKVGYVFPSSTIRPPSSYRFPKLNTRFPVSDRFIAIEKHPQSSCLYAVVSSVSSSILLWDLRNPSEVITELPLPLLRQGRSRFRSLQWHRPEGSSPQTESDNLWLLTSFCWDHDCAIVNALSVFDSTCVTHSSSKRHQMFLQHLDKDTSHSSNLSLVEDPLKEYKKNKNKVPTRRYTFFQNSDSPSDPSDFFPNPFTLYPSPKRSSLPVCDPCGLCFCSSRPPLQVVVYHQIQVPIGTTTIKSEQRYFNPLGPMLTSSETFINEGLHTSLNETPLSQLFHGLAGVTLMLLDVPNKTFDRMETVSVLMGLTFSGRVIFSKLTLQWQKRKIMFPEKTLPAESGPDTILQKFISSLKFPVTKRSQSSALFPHFSPINSLLTGKSHQSADSRQRDSSPDSLPWGPPWSPFPSSFPFQPTEKEFNTSHSFFPSSLDVEVEKYNLRGLHEILKPNEDSLDYRTFIISAKVNFLRLRLETALYWRHPDLNAVFYPEALLTMLLHPIKSQQLVKNEPLPLQLPTIASETHEKNSSQPVKKKADEYNSPEEVIENLIESNKLLHTPITLAELFSYCPSHIQRQDILDGLEKKYHQQKIICWFASTSAVDHSLVEFLSIPSDPEAFEWKPVAENIALPLCSCEAFYKKASLRLNAHHLAAPLIAWCPKDKPLIYNNYIRYVAQLDAVETLARHSKDTRRLRQPSSQRIHKETLSALAKFLFSDHLPVCPKYSTELENSSDGIEMTTVASCRVQQEPNFFCCFPYFLVFWRNPLANETPMDMERVVQGRHYVALDSEAFNKATSREQAFLLKNSPRDYPAYYAFLTGVRVTERLYYNLQNLWPTQVIRSPAPSTFIPSANENDPLYSVSSFTNLLRFASRADTEAAHEEEIRNNEITLEALASQLKRQSTGHQLTASQTSLDVASCLTSSQCLALTLEHLSQDQTIASQSINASSSSHRLS